MDVTFTAYLAEMEKALDAVIHGSKTKGLDTGAYPVPLKNLGDKINRLSADFAEMKAFTQNLADGELDLDAPGRRNYLSAPIKEIHSQLISFNWSIKQLIDGNMVSKLYYSGELYESYNRLVEKVSTSFSYIGEEHGSEWGGPVNSWRYHQLLSALNHLHIMIIEVSESGKIIFANPPARELLSDISQLPYHKPLEQMGALMNYLCSFQGMKPLPTTERLVKDEYPVLHELYFNSGVWYKITSDVIRLADGSYGFLHMIDDISEWKRHEEKLTISATTDSLTGAYNRETGLMLLEDLMAHNTEKNNCIAFIDLDNLKSINDNFGHSQGDKAIKALVSILFETVRETDSVIRYGGDEFIVLFRNCDETSAAMVIERMYEKAKRHSEKNVYEYTLSFSHGIVQLGPGMEKPMDAVKLADEKMYHCKLKKKATMNQFG